MSSRHLESGRSRVPVVLGLVACLLGGGLAYVALRTPPAPRKAQEPQPPQPPRQVAAPASALPPTAQTDARLRDAFGPAGGPGWLRWLVNDDLLMRAVAIVDQASQGLVARDRLEFLAPVGYFRVVDVKGVEAIAPETFARHDAVADVIAALDARRIAVAYRGVEGLFDTAYRVFGYPNRSFADALHPALRRILAVRPAPTTAALVSQGGTYAYADPDLERASPLEKLIWRIGPRNQRIVQAKVAELSRHLGVPDM